MTPYTTLVAAGPESSLGLLTTPSNGGEENDLFATTTAADGSTWAAGWYIEPGTENHKTLTEQGVGGQWSLVPSPNPGTGENGFAGIAAIPGGGLWAVGIAANNGSPSTLVEFHRWTHRVHRWTNRAPLPDTQERGRSHGKSPCGRPRRLATPA